MTWPVCTVIPCTEPAWMFYAREAPFPERFCRHHAEVLFGDTMPFLFPERGKTAASGGG